MARHTKLCSVFNADADSLTSFFYKPRFIAFFFFSPEYCIYNNTTFPVHALLFIVLLRQHGTNHGPHAQRVSQPPTF